MAIGTYEITHEKILESGKNSFLKNGYEHTNLRELCKGAGITTGAKHLLQLKNLVKEYNKRETQCPLRDPDMLAIITGGNMAYTREDGVKVIPIACMKD